MMGKKEQHKKKWEKPKLKTFDINKTYGGPGEHSVTEDDTYHPAS